MFFFQHNMELISDQKEKLKYPKSTWYIVATEFCERFAYFGLRTVLILYLTRILKFSGDESKIIYHSFIFLSYFVSLPCAILADSYWGKFKTILCMSFFYVLGCVVLTGASIADMFSLDVQKFFALLGLFVISVGMSGIQPCVYAFSGEQFQLPHQEKQLQHFTTNYTLAIFVGSLISKFLMPEFRQSIHCFGKDTCFPLAFGVPTLMIFIFIAIFVAGRNKYVKKKPEQKVITRTFGCIFYALRTKGTSAIPCQTHWLDNAKGKYTESEISDTRSVLDLLCVFTAFPVYWSLYTQSGSTWTLQATLMNGHVDFLNWTIKPDQIQMLVPLVGIIVLVFFNDFLYLMLAAIGIRKPLQKLTFCGILAVLTFVFAALLQFKIGNTTEIPSGQGRIYIYNGFDCNVFVQSKSLHVQHQIGPLDMFNVSHTIVSQNVSAVVGITIGFETKCSFVSDNNYEYNTTLTIIEGKEISYHLIRLTLNTIELHRIGAHDSLVKEKFGNPKLRILVDNTFDFDDDITFTSVDHTSFTSYSLTQFRGMSYNAIKVGKYNVFYNGKMLPTPTMDIIPGTFYTLTLQRNGDKMDVRLFAKDEGNYIHVLWQIPQYFIMSIADIVFVTTEIKFIFTEAPISMKSFIASFQFLAIALGSLLVITISTMSFKSQAHEFLLYSGLMFADTLLLGYFSVVYRSKNTNITDAMTPNENKMEETTVVN
ncbi:peptide transporter family 1-like isoform X2 [Metopolophium dirhodum]|uniref:peptide transporter family 1-like isoform X2 n=1 Tax=Metopolophium dirhodum TaxID=44670 RepID=UPI00298FBB24|nr:peptide transporter family 1-like isoform X2 [Metopolophium dirhodum]